MRLVAVVVVALPFLFSIDVATATTLGELTRRCERLESFWRMHPNPEGKVIFPNQGEPAFCFGYLEAIADLGQSIEGPNKCYQTQDGKIGGGCRTTLGFCIPKGATFTQGLAVFLAYARSHVAQWHEEAWPHVINSLQMAFPCQYSD